MRTILNRVHRLLNRIGLFTSRDVAEYLLRERDRLRVIQNNELNNELKKITQAFAELSERGLKGVRYTRALSQYRFYFATVHVLKNGRPLMVIAYIPDHAPVFGKVYLTNCTIECFLPGHWERVAFLYFELKQDKAHIVDLYVQPFCRRQGLGSLMLSLLEDIASSFAMKQISGWLSSVDVRIRDVQIAFYRANGYSVKCHDDQCTEGFVTKDIPTA